MNVLLYLEDGNTRAGHVRTMIESIVQPANLSVVTDYTELHHAVANPFVQQHTIVVLAVESITLLTELAEDPILRSHHRLIVVIPLRNTHAVALGHRLKARYIGDIDDSNDNVGTVLENMIATARSQEPGENLAVN